MRGNVEKLDFWGGLHSLYLDMGHDIVPMCRGDNVNITLPGDIHGVFERAGGSVEVEVSDAHA